MFFLLSKSLFLRRFLNEMRTVLFDAWNVEKSSIFSGAKLKINKKYRWKCENYFKKECHHIKKFDHALSSE